MTTEPERDTTSRAIDDIIAIRNRWHTKRHPLFIELAAGKLDLRVLGTYMAQHAKFVKIAYQAFGMIITRGSHDVQGMIIENLAEEEGLLAGPDGEAHNHMQMIFDFCGAAGMTREEVLGVQPSAAWWGRSLYFRLVCETEPVGAALAMMATQEGQMPELNGEVTIPALVGHYGFARDSKEIRFFVEHELADVEHSRKQIELCARHLENPADQERARIVADESCRLRWEATSDTYRTVGLGQTEFAPPELGAG
jgi:pyrroloquinoline quinone (PQQ) biosynthesis protein C